MGTSSQTPQVMSLHEAFKDRDGDVWVPTGEKSKDGQPLMACPEPRNPEDAGVGESFGWTWRLVETAFGPLKPVVSL